uniref:Uncharacterized protein n=1 Tax=Anguilla anguilla TaxID=7936 RepID=A0A0E9PQV2_ANGAN
MPVASLIVTALKLPTLRSVLWLDKDNSCFRMVIIYASFS